MDILAVYKIRKLHSSHPVRDIVELITSLLDFPSPLTPIVSPQAKSYDLKLCSIMKLKYRLHQLGQWVLCKVPTDISQAQFKSPQGEFLVLETIEG